MIDAATSRRHLWRYHRVELAVMILFATSALVVTVAMIFGGGATPSP